MKTYRLYLSRVVCWYYLIFVGVFFVVSLVLGTYAVLGHWEQSGPPWWIFSLPVLVAGYWLLWMLRVPFEIGILDDGMIEFRSLLGKNRVQAREIESVKARRAALGLADVRCTSRKFHLLLQIDGLHEFLTILKTKNPDVEIRGC